MATSFYQTVYDFTPSDTTCEAPYQTYRQSYTDTNKALDTLRSGPCLTDNVKYAEEIESSLKQKEQLVADFDKERIQFESYLDSVGVLQNARGPFDTYLADLKAQYAALEKENYDIQQRIRAGRRRFMDAEPQRGVKSILGLQTTDDKILLAFWICFAIAVLAIEFVILMKYGEELQILSNQQKAVFMMVGLLFAAGIAFFAIRKFG